MRRAKGKGSVTRRKDGRWQARYQVNGTRKHVYAKTRREVAKKLTEALSEVNKGLVYDDKGITLAKHLEGWLGSSRSSLRISTWERYEQICRKHIIPEMGHQELKNLSPTATQDLYRRKLNTLSPRTVQYIHVTLRRSLSQALKWNLVPKNVAGLVDPPKVTKEEMRPLTAEEVNVLFESVKDTPLEALYVLAATTGLRRGEMLALKWSDIDLDARTLYVRRNLSLTKNGPVLVPPKTTKGKRSIKLCKICIEDRS